MLTSSLCCVIQDARGRYRVSAREADIFREPPQHRYVDFDTAYRIACRLNAHRADERRAAARRLS
jgi:hypothetical protein